MIVIVSASEANIVILSASEGSMHFARGTGMQRSFANAQDDIGEFRAHHAPGVDAFRGPTSETRAALSTFAGAI
jgi:hypothetical protein